MIKNFWLLFVGYLIVVVLTVFYFSEGVWVPLKLTFASAIYGVFYVLPHFFLHAKYFSYEKERSRHLTRMQISEKEWLDSLRAQESMLKARNVKHGASWIKYGMFFSWMDYELVTFYFRPPGTDDSFEMIVTSLDPELLTSLKKSVDIKKEYKWLPLV